MHDALHLPRLPWTVTGTKDESTPVQLIYLGYNLPQLLLHIQSDASPVKTYYLRIISQGVLVQHHR